MQDLKFDIHIISSDMCRITTRDCRTELKKISDGACICSIEIMLGVMKDIEKKAREKGYNAVFENLVIE